MLDKGRHPTNARGEQWPPEIFNIILKSVQKKEGRKEREKKGGGGKGKSRRYVWNFSSFFQTGCDHLLAHRIVKQDLPTWLPQDALK